MTHTDMKKTFLERFDLQNSEQKAKRVLQSRNLTFSLNLIRIYIYSFWYPDAMTNNELNLRGYHFTSVIAKRMQNLLGFT